MRMYSLPPLCWSLACVVSPWQSPHFPLPFSQCTAPSRRERQIWQP